MKILIFAASLRRESLNKKLATQTATLLKTKAEVDLADFREFEMPVYDGDLEASAGIPAGAKKLAERIRQADAVIISTPEYNGGMPGPLKNALDWVSRETPIAFSGKALLLLGASPGALGAIRSLWHTRVPFEAIGTFVYPEMFGLPKAHEAFDDKGQFLDSKNQDRLDRLLQNFLKMASTLNLKN